jgi:F-type H+-transporting ATPase subunit a
MSYEHNFHLATPLGDLLITQAVWTTWIIMVLLVVASAVLTMRLQSHPNRPQAAAEGLIEAMLGAVKAVAPEHAALIFPFVATLWLFIIFANVIGIVPEMKSPTADLATTSALAIVVFFSVHWFGIRSEGVKSYLQHYLSPTPIMLPFHIISEISRTIALAVRLFGNMMSLEMAAMMLLLVAGFLIPVPLLMLHIVEALVQAYIFGMLALVYIASGIEAQRRRTKEVIGGPQ